MSANLTRPVASLAEFAWLASADVAVAEMALTGPVPDLLPAEQVFVASAVASRVREFAFGRACARRAMADLGLPAVALPVAGDRTPVWPDGVTGSITHSARHSAAAVARTGSGIVSIGIDLEPAEPLDDDLVSSICRPDEMRWLRQQPATAQLLLARAIFSAKESVFKCLYPVSRRSMEFEDIGVEIDVAAGTFAATLKRSQPPIAEKMRLDGRLVISPAHIATATVLRNDR